MRNHEEELGIKMVPFSMVVYVQDEDAYYPEDEVPAGSRILNLSGTELRNRLVSGREIPEWFTFPEVAGQLRSTYPPRSRQGITIFFTGLSGAGKSTIANVILVKLLEMGGVRSLCWTATSSAGTFHQNGRATSGQDRDRRTVKPKGGLQ